MTEPEQTAGETTLEQQMQQKCLEWQQRLRLLDWDVSVKVVPAMDMGHERAQGTVRWQITEKRADIKLVTSEDAARMNLLRPYSMEETLIHELLHLHIAPFEPTGEAECTAMEWCINAIAGALLQLSPKPDAGEGNV